MYFTVAVALGSFFCVKIVPQEADIGREKDMEKRTQLLRQAPDLPSLESRMADAMALLDGIENGYRGYHSTGMRVLCARARPGFI